MVGDGSQTIDVRGDEEWQRLAKETWLVDDALRKVRPSTRHTVELSAREQTVLYLKSDDEGIGNTAKMATRAQGTFEEFWPTLEEGESGGSKHLEPSIRRRPKRRNARTIRFGCVKK